MEYVDLDLRVTRLPDNRYEVSIIGSPTGEVSEVVELPLSDPEFNDFCRDAQLRRRGTEGDTGDSATADAKSEKASRGLGYGQQAEVPREATEVATAIGQRLFESVFSGEMLACYRSAYHLASRDSKGLRLRLRLNAPELATVPWEFLYDDHSNQHVSLTRQTPISRYLEIAEPQQSLTVKPPLRILGVIASPADLPTLDVESERRQMEKSVDHLVNEEGVLELTWLADPTIRGLQTALSRDEWHVLHFIGHGGFDADADEGYLAFCDDEGKCDRLYATQLANVLSGPNAVRLAVLNCCEGARGSAQNLYSSVGAILTRRNIPAVISMQYEITDIAAIEFARAVYDQIATGAPIDAAIQEARIAISVQCRNSVEWATPVLHMRSVDGMLFDISFRDAVFQNAPGQKIDYVSVGGQQRGRELNILMARVHEYWAADEDLNPLKSQLVPLEMEVMPDAVTHPIRRNMAEFGLAKLFFAYGGSVLILGDPGSGKTTALVTIADKLIDRAQDDVTAAVPVIVPLSSWSGEPMLEWLVEQIRVRYLIPEKDVRDWLTGNQLVLLLDGLDEVVEPHRLACVEAINDIAPEVGLAGIGVSCRTREYLDLEQHLALTAAVRLKNLSDSVVENHLAAQGNEFSGLQRLLKQDSSMRILARSPLMLGLMKEVYRGEAEEDSSEDVAVDAKTRRTELMDSYVNQMFARARGQR